MRIDIVTLFPELFTGPLAIGLVGRALGADIATVGYIDPRSFTHDRHRTVDDAPYGGGAGMVMKIEPLAAAVKEARTRGDGPVVLLSPQGRPLRQADLARWAAGDHLVLVAGRYEGFDERVRSLVDDEVSLGDFVLTGGEIPALAIVDGVVRLLPGTLHNEESVRRDSHAEGRLEHPQYTRPPEFEGMAIPEVLRGGHHEAIAAWRRAESLARTRARRPELLTRIGLTVADRAHLAESPAPGRLSVAVKARLDPAALEGLVRVAAAYDVERVWWVDGDPDVLAAASVVEVERPDPRPRRRRRAPRVARLDPRDRVEVVLGWAELAVRADGRRLGAARAAEAVVSAEEIRENPEPYCLCFGDGAEAIVEGWLAPIRLVSGVNDLPWWGAIVAALERIRSER